jgi:hypothetical protein
MFKKMFKSIADWIDSPKGSKVGLILAKVLVLDALLASAIIGLLFVGYLTGNFTPNTSEPELLFYSMLMTCLILVAGAFWAHKTQREDYQKALQRARSK